MSQSVEQIPISVVGNSGGSAFWKYTVETFDDLAAIPFPIEGDIARVRSSQGTKWLPGGLGGTYYPSGLYEYHGGAWEMDNTIKDIAFEIQEINDDLVAIYADVTQDFSSWVGNGQKLNTVSWISFDNSIVDTDGFHDGTINESGTATGVHSANTLQDTSKAWTVNQWAGYMVKITGGTNADEFVKVLSNTSDTLTIDANWIITVDNTSTYEISLTSRFTAPEDGFYQINVKLTFSNSTTGLRGVFLYKNNVFNNSIFLEPVDNVESVAVLPPEFIQMTAGEYIEVKSYQTAAVGHGLLSFGKRNRVTITKIAN